MNAKKIYSVDKLTATTVVSVCRLNQAKLFSFGMTVSVVVQAKLFSVSISSQATLFFLVRQYTCHFVCRQISF